MKTLPALLALVAFAPAIEAAEPDTRALPFVTHHRGVFNGQTVDYTATVGAQEIVDAAGRASARFVFTSYVRDGAEPATRPVLFLFNGGPSTSSATLHMTALGPRRIVVEQDP